MAAWNLVGAVIGVELDLVKKEIFFNVNNEKEYGRAFVIPKLNKMLPHMNIFVQKYSAGSTINIKKDKLKYSYNH
jgi:hypothetical protein